MTARERKNWIWLGFILGLVLVLLALPSGCSSRVKMTITQLFSPLLETSTGLRLKLDHMGKAATSQMDLVRQSEELHEEVVRLETKLLRLREVERENERLRKLLEFKSQASHRLKPARVINRAASNWWITMDVDVGSRDGVRENMAVVSHAGLVGKTTSVGPDVARVLLVADPNCRVAAMIETTRDSGIIEGDTRASLESPRCLMRFINRTSEPQIGDAVITSGLDQVYPKGIRIGRIAAVAEEEYGLYKTARIELAADLMHLEEVLVVMPE